jgi:predicted flap endonuclease-1-like 5' DNA nuclease
MPWGVPETEIDRLAAQHGLTAVEFAYYDDAGMLVIVYRGKQYRPKGRRPERVEGYGKTNTLPADVAVSAAGGNCPGEGTSPPRGPNRPASFLTGDSDPPKASSASNDVGPESPSEATVIASGAKQSPPLANNTTDSASLDDFTAIDGVGPVTAQKLHDLGLFTYNDIRLELTTLDAHGVVSKRTLTKIKAWLDQRLV